MQFGLEQCRFFVLARGTSCVLSTLDEAAGDKTAIGAFAILSSCSDDDHRGVSGWSTCLLRTRFQHKVLSLLRLQTPGGAALVDNRS